MIKKIHYVWVGGKPLPSLARKCIKSWRKHLPDWEIMEWNEKNFDINNSIEFVRQAYAQKKWAFVADYIRTKVLYEQGGIYFDTDMEVIGDISKYLKKPAFLGREYEGDEREMICAGVMYFSKPNNKLLKDMLNFYESVERFNSSLMYSCAIPKIITKILDNYPVRLINNGVEVFDDTIWVYPKDYFYPVNYDWTKDFYSKNTVMIHHYDASWTGSSNKRNVFLRRIMPKYLSKAAISAIGVLSILKNKFIHKAITINLKIRSKISIYINTKKRLDTIQRHIDNFQKNDYIFFSNPNWIGVSNVAKEMFGGYVPISEINGLRQTEKDEIVNIILKSNKKMIIFNGLVAGWEEVIESIKAKNKIIIIKVLYHGGDVRLARDIDYASFMKILGLHNMGLIDQIGFVKKQQAEFYNKKGYRVAFVANNVKLSKTKYSSNILDSKIKPIKIGLYCSGDYEWKNVFNQIAAVSLIPNIELDIVPVNPRLSAYADKLKLMITGSEHTLSRVEILQRMSNNDLNLNVSFAEAAPLMPLESLELGVPCLTGNNHHYWQDSILADLLIVNRPDDIIAIYEKINNAIINRKKILNLYKKWKVRYDNFSDETIKDFIRVN